jgi:hypothetical protein
VADAVVVVREDTNNLAYAAILDLNKLTKRESNNTPACSVA